MSDNAREIFQKNLEHIMRLRGVTNTDICLALGVASGTVSSWVTGKKYPRVDVMQRLADYLGVRMSMLTSEDGMKDLEDMERLEALHQNPRLRLLFDRSRKMKPEDVETMLAVTSSILKELDGE